jgi:cytochrome c peroxidase
MRPVKTIPILLASLLLVYPVQASDWAERALKRIATPPLGLPELHQPADNHATTDKIILGRKLFFDRRLSRNKTMSCAMCHVPEQGFGNNELATPIGVEGRSLKRNAPTILNVAYHRTMFHDGRDNALETQIYGPFLSNLEMANPSVGWLLQTIGGLEDYWGMFEKAFGEPVNARNLGAAIAAYQRTVLSANSSFDKWQYGGQKTALSEQAVQGLKLFKGKAACIRCHLIGKTSALFTDHKFHNTGIGVKSDIQAPADRGPVQVEISPGVTVPLPRRSVEAVGEKHQKDLGRLEVTNRPSDLYRFKTPILRNVAVTAPYMHDGSLRTLAEVVAFYNNGPSKALKPLHLSKKEQQALVAFLKSLTGDNINELIGEARSQPADN